MGCEEKRQRKEKQELLKVAAISVSTTKEKHHQKKKKQLTRETSVGKKRKQEEGNADDTEPHKKKKVRKDTKGDPSRDSMLSDQGRKALVYAYAKKKDPNNWKFNKSRQNWLIRNIWNVQAVPDVYAHLVYRYFAGMQGYARQNLLKKCEEILQSQDLSNINVNDSDEMEQSHTSSAEPNFKEIRRMRAQTIFNSLKSSASEAEQQPSPSISTTKDLENN